MPEEETIIAEKLKFNGIFDMKDFYAFLYDVMVSMGYDVQEDHYKQKELQAGNQLEISWTCDKNVDDYTKFVIKVNYFIVGLKTVEVQKGDVKVSSNKGDIEMKFKAVLRTDYEGRWEAQPFLKIVKKLYENYLYRSSYMQWKKKISEELNQLHNEAKAFFHLQRISS